MGRKTTVVEFSVSPTLAKEYEKLADQQKTTKSELFRRMLLAYKTTLEEEEFLRVQQRMAGRARKKGLLTEKEVERIVLTQR